MYASKSFNHRRTIEAVLSRRESYAARTALRRAVEKATDQELRLAVRGTWIELELGDGVRRAVYDDIADSDLDFNCYKR